MGRLVNHVVGLLFCSWEDRTMLLTDMAENLLLLGHRQ